MAILAEFLSNLQQKATQKSRPAMRAASLSKRKEFRHPDGAMKKKIIQQRSNQIRGFISFSDVSYDNVQM